MTLAPIEVELKVFDLDASRAFYVDGIGFTVAYERPEDDFVALRRGPVALLLEAASADDRVAVGPLERPLGRGINLQIAVEDAAAALARCEAAGYDPMLPLEERWYRADAVEVGNRQFWVQDPDGYLLRLAEDLGTRPVS